MSLRRKNGAPTQREVGLAKRVRAAADLLIGATDYAQTYVARVELANAIADLSEFHRARSAQP